MGKERGSDLSRRAFLRQMVTGMGALGAGLVLPASLSARTGILDRTKDSHSVLVLGAGLSGLAAAWELIDAGHDVTVLEARTRPGGRVSTVREPFPGDLYAEEGAVAFSGTYTQAIRFIDKLGLERMPWSLPKKPVVYYLNGKRLVAGPNQPVQWPYELTPEEQKLGPMGIIKKYIIDTLPAEISSPGSWDNEPLIKMDQQSLAEYLRSQGASEGAIKLIRNTQWFGAVPDETSALSMAVSDFGLFMGGAPFVLPGGNDQLPRGMADGIKDHIRYGVEVKSIRTTDSGVEVTASRDNEAAKFDADRVVCTLPATVLRNVKIEPALPAAQRKAIEQLPYMNMTRTYLHVDQNYWGETGVANMAFSDLPVGQVTGHVSNSTPEAVLESYAVGPKAVELAQKSRNTLVEDVKQGIDKVFPGIHEHFQQGYVKAWSEDPYALGGPSWPAPGDVTSYLKTLQKPHGQIHFAGEHTSILRSTMEGALRSGVRAAKEVHEMA